MLKDLHCQFAAEGSRHRVVLSCLEHALVVGRIDDDEHIVMVLCRRTEHRRTADIDVFDGFIKVTIWFGDRGFKRIEIHHDHIDRPNIMLLHLLDVGRNRSPAEQSAMDFRMQGFHTAIKNFR